MKEGGKAFYCDLKVLVYLSEHKQGFGIGGYIFKTLHFLCLVSSNHWRAFLKSPWRKGSSLLFGKLLELFLFSKEIKMPKKIIGQYLSFQSFQGL